MVGKIIHCIKGLGFRRYFVRDNLNKKQTPESVWFLS